MKIDRRMKLFTCMIWRGVVMAQKFVSLESLRLHMLDAVSRSVRDFSKKMSKRLSGTTMQGRHIVLRILCAMTRTLTVLLSFSPVKAYNSRLHLSSHLARIIS
jgi:hypothetical protein